MAKLPLELQRRIKQQAGAKSLARHEECKPTCVEVNHRNDEMELIYDTTGRAFAESGWEPMESAHSNQVEARANGGCRTMVRLRDPQRRLSYWLWSGPDPLLTYDEEIDWLDLPGLKKAGGKRAKVASRGASRPRNVSALVDAPFEHDPYNHGSDFWRRHEAQLDWINARVPASCYEWPRGYDDYQDHDSEPPLPREWWNPWLTGSILRTDGFALACLRSHARSVESLRSMRRIDALNHAKEQEDAVRRMRRQERLSRKRCSYYVRVRKPRRQQLQALLTATTTATLLSAREAVYDQIRERRVYDLHLKQIRERGALLARQQADRMQLMIAKGYYPLMFAKRHRAELARLDLLHSAELVQHDHARKAPYASARSGQGGNGNIYHVLCQDYDGGGAAGGDGIPTGYYTECASGRRGSSPRAPRDGLASAHPERGWQGSLRDAWQSLSAQAREERSRM